MLGRVEAVFGQVGPELLAKAVQALKSHPQPPYGRPAQASGRTAAALQEQHGDDFAQVTGPAYLQTLLTGRGPTRGSNQGGPKLSAVLAQWARDKPGFQLDPGSTYERFGFLLARKMHREGSALFRLGQPSGLFDQVLPPDYLDLLKARIAAGELTAITSALRGVLA